MLHLRGCSVFGWSDAAPLGRREVPASPRVDTAWINDALRRGGCLQDGATVTASSCDDIKLEVEDGEDVENGGGIAGAKILRIQGLEYSGGSLDTVLPLGLIHKWCTDAEIVPSDWQDRAFVFVVLAQKLVYDIATREAWFYSTLASSLTGVGVRTPRLYYCGQDGEMWCTWPCCFLWRRDSISIRTSMLLEDLTTSGFVSCGHQIMDAGTPVDDDVVAAALQTMARLHAWGWGGRGDTQLSTLTAAVAGWHWTNLKLNLPKFRSSDRLGKFIDMFGYGRYESEFAILQEPEVQAALWDMRANVHRWLPRVKSLDQKQTMLHGDYHRANMFMKRNSDGVEIAVFDWSFFGTGHVSWEVSYYLKYGLGTDASLEREEELLRIYHEALLAARPEVEYTLDQLREDLKLVRFCFLCFIMSPVVFGSPAKMASFDTHLDGTHEDLPGELGKREFQVTTDKLVFGLRRIVEYHRDQAQWGDFFSGAVEPDPKWAARTPEQAAAVRQRLQEQYREELEKKRQKHADKQRRDQGQEEEEREGQGEGLGASLL